VRKRRGNKKLIVSFLFFVYENPRKNLLFGQITREMAYYYQESQEMRWAQLSAMKPWGTARWLTSKISMRSTEPADWLENTGCGIKWIF
jgi:hypothetical protein